LLPFCLPAAHFDAVHSTKGRIAVVTDAELDAMATPDITDEGCGVDGQAVWFWLPDAGVKLRKAICAAMVAK
jgi:hypothetical protein